MFEHASSGLLAHGKATDDEVLEDAVEVVDGEFFGAGEAAVARDISEEIDGGELAVDGGEQFGDGSGV